MIGEEKEVPFEVTTLLLELITYTLAPCATTSGFTGTFGVLPRELNDA
ncbi:hypothetical protein KAOT1_10756 [Kordia algicida OT-1]|uniref:Uncharacterized protein n=1 Tax=Kordia algicida OT-1 TaxID=391587 RepID=A9E2J5_9FLAO|nr:hypothetical protein KAOT1_10756 [Kordia algicida OT-1]